MKSAVFASSLLMFLLSVALAATSANAQVQVSAPTLSTSNPSSFVAAIRTNNISTLGIVAYEFNVAYDPAVIRPLGANFGCSTAGTTTGSAGLSAICNVTTSGVLRISVFGVLPITDSGTALLGLNFETTPGALSGTSSPLTMQSVSFFNAAGRVSTTSTNGNVSLLTPTAAEVAVAGRVLDANGRAVSAARIKLTDSDGNIRVALSNPFGFYKFDRLASGASYVVGAEAKGLVFQSRILQVSDEIADFDLMADR